jgi:hypothetical protein
MNTIFYTLTIFKELRFQMATEEELQILSLGFNSLSVLTHFSNKYKERIVLNKNIVNLART